MITIAIIGASGQVGTEVCLFLMTNPDVQPVAIVRSEVSGAMLRRLGVEVRLCNLDDEYQCREVFADCDLLVDFSVPPGEVSDITAHYDRNITHALQCARGRGSLRFYQLDQRFRHERTLQPG